MTPDLDQLLTHDRVPFTNLADGFEAAMSGGRRAHHLLLVIAGFPVAVRIVGDTWFAAVERATGHLGRFARVEDAVLRIDVWDVLETGVVASGTELPEAAPLVVMKMSDDGRYVGEERRHTRLWLDQEGSRIVGCTQDAARMNLDERARPFHKLVSHWLEQRQVQFLHAGLVSCDATGLLFVGNGGAGKSTSSICCLRAGMGYLGDDFVGFSEREGVFSGHGLYASCLLDSHHLQRFPDLAGRALAPHFAFEHKHVLYLDRDFAGVLGVSQVIHGLALPRVVDSPVTSFEPASRMDGLRALAPTSVMYLARPSRAAFDRVAALAESVPSYWLNLGRDIEMIAPTVRRLMSAITAHKSGKAG